MNVSARTINYKGMNIPAPVLPVELHVMPDFTGRVVLYIESGKVKCDRRLRDDEHICALDTFIEMAREMGYPLQEAK
jgi:hypothetical protein